MITTIWTVLVHCVSSGAFPVVWLGIAAILGFMVMGLTETSFETINMRYVPIDLLHHHPENPRDPKRYEKGDVEFGRTLAQMEHGWDYDHPAAIISNADGRYPELPRDSYRMLVGNRRLAVARYKKIERVPCVIVTGLSKAEEIRRLHDHAGVVGLSDAEKLEAFKSLRNAGLARDEICIRLGWLKKDGAPQLNTFNKFKRIAAVPSDIQEGWKKYDNGNKALGIKFTPTGEALEALESAISEDVANGFMGEPSEGPRYQAALATLEGNFVKPPKNYARKETMEGFASNLQKYPLLRMLMLTFAGKQDKHDVEDIWAGVRYVYDIGVGRDPGPRPAIMDAKPEPETVEPKSESVEPETTDSEPGPEPDTELVAVEPGKVALPALTPKRKQKN